MWAEFAKFGRAHGFTAGLDFKTLVDKPHLEMRYDGMTADDLFLIYEEYGLRGVWRVFDRIRGVPPETEWRLP